MVSGCCDGIFIKRCAEFLFGSSIQHFQWTDNSAARQLVARQGVGRIRHLSGKILWIQQCVLDGDVSMGQVPTLMNFSDIGTKCLPKGRLNFLLHEIGAMDPATLELVGEEEHAMVVEQQRNREAVGKLIKFVKRMSLVLGIQGLKPVGVEGAEVETCKATSEGNEELLMVWFFMAVLLALWVGFAIAAFALGSGFTEISTLAGVKLQKKMRTSKRIDDLVFRCNEIQKNMDDSAAEVSDRITEVSNELSMTHDYTTGLHYAIVEHGGFLRNGLGLSREQWSHLNVLERANLVSSRTMGSVEYMRVIRQRVMPVGTAEETDGAENEEPNEATESEHDEPMNDGEIQTDGQLGSGFHTVEGMLEFLKREHNECLDRSEFWDANSIQNTILRFLDDVRLDSAEGMVPNCRAKISSLFSNLADQASDQGRWDSANRYTAMSGTYDD